MLTSLVVGVLTVAPVALPSRNWLLIVPVAELLALVVIVKEKFVDQPPPVNVLVLLRVEGDTV